MTNEKQRRFISLFGGVGGFDKPIIEEGWKSVFYNDFDKWAVQVYNHNFGTSYKPKDIRQVHTRDIPDHELLVGGFPCQSFSIAGKRKGFEDTRGTMFFEVARIIKDKKPKYFILENVKGLLNHDKGNTFRTILCTIDELGYDAEWCVLNSKDFGVPQNRERVYIIGHLRGECRLQVFPLQGTNPEDTRSIGEDLSYCISATYSKGKYGKGRGTLINIGNVNPSGKGMNGEVYSSEGISPTVTTNKGEGPKIIQINNPTHSNNRVYDSEGVSPTLRTRAGGNQEPFIIVKNATKSGYDIATEGDAINLAAVNSKTRRGRVGKQVAQTLDTGCNQGVMCPVGGVFQPYPRDYKNQGLKREERFEPRKDGNVNTILTKEIKNLIAIPVLTPDRMNKRQNGRRMKEDGEAMFTLTSQDRHGLYDGYLIRKLTPTECERLQGFPDGWTSCNGQMSDTQRYKQMGNAVTTNVVRYLIRQINKQLENEKN
jgi:DNA (cytosine-5)-methyltransferase 1